MKNIKKLMVFILTLSILLSSLTISVCADEIINGYNNSDKNYRLCDDEPTKKKTEK